MFFRIGAIMVSDLIFFMKKNSIVARRETRASSSTITENKINSPEGEKICDNLISGMDSTEVSFNEIAKSLTMETTA